MMKPIIIKEIDLILKQLFIIDDDARASIKSRVDFLDDEKISQVEKLLLELYEYQIKILATYTTKNPQIFKQLADLKTEVEKTIKQEKNSKVEEETKKKIVEIMQKINSL